MEVLSYIILILLSSVGYSGGTAGRAGKNTDVKPVAGDLILVALIWTAAVYSRLTFDLNKWLLIIVWVAISVVVGMGAVSFRHLPKDIESKPENKKEAPSGFFKLLWHRWRGFSRKMGSFQSRLMLSFFFFIIISPAALVIKVAGDPLRIKKKKAAETFWLEKKESAAEIEDYRRQF